MKREDIWSILDNYQAGRIKIGCIASHSALDVADGAVEEGFGTVLYCQRGREKTYTRYFRAQRQGEKVIRGVTEDFVVLDKFSSILDKKEMERIVKDNVLFVPNRAFSSYVPIEKIEKEFYVPLLGSRNLLRSEERGEEKDYYWLLKEAGLPHPTPMKPDEIDRLVIVKLHHAVKKLERGFFTAASKKEYDEKSSQLLKQGIITKEDLKTARIEEYIIGPVFNLDFFYSPIEMEMEKIELLGIDWRFETSLDGHVRLPAVQQLTLNKKQITPEYTVCGHNSATLRESLLEDAFLLAEKYVEATQKYFPPGIIGPFCLQTCVDKDLNFYIYDVAPRIGGGTNVHVWVGHPYANMLWRTNMSTGRRLAREVRRAIEMNRLREIVT